MPDLMTHLAASYLVKRTLAPERHMLPFLLGAALPDIVSYLPLGVTVTAPPLLARFASWNPDAIPLWAKHFPEFFYPFHGVIPFALLSCLLAFLFPAAGRGRVFLNILLGGLLHLLMDLLQVSHNQSGYLLFPLSWRSFSLGWIETESSLYAAPFLCAAAAAFLLHDRRNRRGWGRPAGRAGEGTGTAP